MAAQVVSLFQRFSQTRDWSQQELAEFYRVENALIQAGLRIETERGVTDDGEPWFAFCRADDGEVFIHFARIEGEYIVAGPAYEGVSRGWDFAALVRDLISRHPLVQMGPARKSAGNVFMHPAALLIAVVGTAFFKTGEARADDGHHRHEGGRRLLLSSSSPLSPIVEGSGRITVDANQTLTLVASAMAAAVAEYENANRAGEAVPAWRMLAESLGDGAASQAPALPAATDSFAASSPEHRSASATAADLGAWLSLAVVLSDVAVVRELDDSAIAASLRTSEISDLAELALAAPAPTPEAPAPTSSGQPLFLLVDLAAGPLPDVAAVRLIRELGLLDSAQVLRVSELPKFLLDFIANGEHFTAAPIVEHGAPDVLTPVVDAGTDVTGIIDTTPTIDTSVVADASNPVVQPSTDVTPPPVVESAPPTTDASSHAVLPNDSVSTPHFTDAQIRAAIDHFMQYTPNLQVIADGDHVVLMDQWVRYGLLTSDQVETVTFTFDDGSTVSLVGRATAVHDLLPHG